jgi:hypothetical protein
MKGQQSTQRGTQDLAVVTYQVDNLEELAEAAQARGLPIKVRLQPTVFRAGAAEGASSNYVSWRGVSWVIESQTVEGVRQFKRVIDLVMRAIAQGRLAAVEEALGVLTQLQEPEEG